MLQLIRKPDRDCSAKVLTLPTAAVLQLIRKPDRDCIRDIVSDHTLL